MSGPDDPFSFDAEFGDPDYVKSARDPNLPPQTGKEWVDCRASDIPVTPTEVSASPFADLDDEFGTSDAPASQERTGERAGTDDRNPADDFSEEFETADALCWPARTRPTSPRTFTHCSRQRSCIRIPMRGSRSPLPTRDGGKPDEARHSPAFDLAGAAEFAEEKGTGSISTWLLHSRQGETGPNSKGRASDANALTGPLRLGRLRRRWAITTGSTTLLKDKNLRTSMLVMTGRTPHKRGHPYFKLASAATPAELRNANTALKTLLGTDNVENPSRVMRLAGTISYPPPHKEERGYTAELVTLHIWKRTRQLYTVEQVDRPCEHTVRYVGVWLQHPSPVVATTSNRRCLRPVACPASGTTPFGTRLRR